MKYKAVLFDLDGTLLDTLDDLADSMNAVLEANDLAVHPVDSYRQFVGDGVVMLVRRALGRELAQDDQLVEELTAQMRQEYSNRWDNQSRPYPGVAEMLDALDSKGVKKTILSNKPHDFTQLCVSKLLGDWSFDVILGVNGEIPPKPAAVGVRHVVDQLAMTPDDFVYLGDTDTDMNTAVAAGMLAVGAGWGFRDRAELLGNGAKTVIDQPCELLEFFEPDSAI
ncbi:MAG: HAD family hydrolase [Phycisphaerae bacterium]